MSIATVQKRRFLNNIYRLLYSSGAKIDESIVRSVFNEYFSVNSPGFPINVDYNVLRSIAKTDVDILNQIMVNTVFNVDVLYETVSENNEKLFSIVTSLNKKLENLKEKRSQLESLVDDLLFVNSNTDGYFYSYTENFSKTNNIDLRLTDSAFVDPVLKNVTISKLKSEQFNIVTLDNLKNVNPDFFVYINGQKTSDTVDSTNFLNVFDGLNDTYWSHTVALKYPQSVTMSIIIPVSVFSLISKIDGVLLTSSPTNVLVRANPQDSSKGVQLRSKDSRGDYGSFSFSIPSDQYASLEVVLQKNEPDYIESNTDSPYIYRFGLRDLIIGSKYYARSGTLVSGPISLPVEKNSSLVIDAVSIDVKEQTDTRTSMNYYVAPDNPSAQNISDFAWSPISPLGSERSGYPSVVSFDGSSKMTIPIKTEPDKNSLSYIPKKSISQNSNELNPTTKIYIDKNVHRIAALDSKLEYYNPILLGGTNCFNHYYILNLQESQQNVYKDLGFWNDQLIRKPNTLLSSVLKEQIGSIIPGINTASSGYIKTSIIRYSSSSVNHTVIKSSADFNLAIYLNGVLIGDLPKGTLTKAIQWNFIQGENKLNITYDKQYAGQINFSLIEGLNISRYGSIFVNMFNYLDPIEYQNRATNDNYFFTIDTVFGRKEILCTKDISGDSNFIFTSKNHLNVLAIRYRVDLNRYDNPYCSPILESIKIKFRHGDI
jgi:hypothetical protein